MPYSSSQASAAHAVPLTAPRQAGPDLSGPIDLVRAELDAVNRCIAHHLESDVALIRQLGAYIINSGGKRLRPMTLLLSSNAFAGDGATATKLAAVVEFIHTATLLHDDVVDRSELRRGQSSANHVWGNEASVLVGDFLYSRSFEMMVEVGDMRVMEVMAKATNTIAEGEVMQLLNSHSAGVDESQYLETIRRKTATLFQAAAQLGPVIAGQSAEVQHDLAKYGLHLGIAFQLIDDVLDYSAKTEDIGKNIGDDLAEGKPTLPVIHSMIESGPAQRELLQAAIEAGAREKIDAVLDAIESTGSLAYTSRRAKEQARFARQALSSIPDSPYQRALLELADFAVDRAY
ncbi:MAG: polyprenyl synthetase family protein [Gammaproteobacteria bacterium]|nr:polyprenyl synthetase family protein [Gammaproteobacteria bacterium]MDH3467839.1 polyprenyl synthetase family protein [Gammaproteobacteria bacterium]